MLKRIVEAKEYHPKIKRILNSKNWEEVLEKNENEIVKCEVYTKDYDTISILKEKLKDNEFLQVFGVGKGGIEITQKRCIKGHCSKIYCRLLQYS